MSNDFQIKQFTKEIKISKKKKNQKQEWEKNTWSYANYVLLFTSEQIKYIKEKKKK